jgi:hypothetical protein
MWASHGGQYSPDRAMVSSWLWTGREERYRPQVQGRPDRFPSSYLWDWVSPASTPAVIDRREKAAQQARAGAALLVGVLQSTGAPQRLGQQVPAAPDRDHG